ncbi:MAG: Gfo/Idh/MocA family oxidoreductase [Gemmataceae bacterium]
MIEPTSPRKPGTSRRRFLQTSAAATGAALALSQVPFVHAKGGTEILRIGLVGCGGRGTGAAEQALRADPNVHLVAVADTFRDRLDSSLRTLTANRAIADRIRVPDERKHVGFNGARDLIASDVNVVLLCTPPHFRPAHIRLAVENRKHIFAEKPCAVDAPGVRSVLESCRTARERRLAVVSGLCWRYHGGMRDTFRHIHDGAVGEIQTMQCNYLTGGLWNHPRQPAWSDMEFQVRNWLYFTWLSGDFNVEQHVHSLDKMAWAMRDVYPVRCYGLGGRQVRTGPEYGHIYDHMSCVYEWENGVKCFSLCRQMPSCYNEVKDYVWGSEGKVDVMGHNITGRRPWRYSAAAARRDDMYQQEHNELFASIRRGEPINNGEYMAKSSLMGIMGRMACYTGQTITWDQAMNSRQDLSPPRYEWMELPTPPVARPGVTTFS